MNSGSLESLKYSTRCGFRPNADQIRPTQVSGETPAALAIERVDQRVASLSLASKVLTTICLTLSSLILRGAPGRGSSKGPSRRSAMKRRRHLPTFALLKPRRVATDSFEGWSLAAHDSTILVRSANACAALRGLLKRSGAIRSSSLSSSGAFGLPRRRAASVGVLAIRHRSHLYG
jgi:hypothetical protein